MVVDGMTADEIVTDLPYLKIAGVAEALRFAALEMQERDLRCAVRLEASRRGRG